MEDHELDEFYNKLEVINKDCGVELDSWNYRVVRKGDQYIIAEVYYKKHGGIFGWVDVSSDCLIKETYEDLKGTYDYIRYAFERPVLVVVKGNKLKEDI